MEWISQSSVVRTAPDKFAAQLVTRPGTVVASSEAPVLHWWADSLSEGALMHYKLLVGMHRIEWSARIRKCREGSHIEATLDQGPFQSFRSVHLFRPYQSDRTLVRDALEFAADPEIEALLRDCVVWHGNAEVPAQADDSAQTGEMRIIGEEVG
jgi:hypothetical protein